MGNNDTNFKTPSRFIEHSKEVAGNVEAVYDRLGLPAQEGWLAGLFHDIGRCFAKDPKGHTFHEIGSGRIIERDGVELKLSPDQAICDRLAQSVRSHFLVAEQFRMPEYAEWLPGFRDVNPALLTPTSWQEFAVVYGDMTASGKDRHYTFTERISSIKDKDGKAGSSRLVVVEQAEGRLYGVERMVLKAMETKNLTGLNTL